MATAGPNSPGTGETESAGGGLIPWSLPGNILASDDSRSTVTLGTSTSDYLKATNFGFSIPAGATINGITVAIERHDTDSNCNDAAVRIIKGGTIGSTDKSAAGWPDGPPDGSPETYGGTSDLWGETWTADDINASTFGFAIKASGTSASPSSKARVDHITISIDYTEAAGHPAQRRAAVKLPGRSYHRPLEIGHEGVVVN